MADAPKHPGTPRRGLGDPSAYPGSNLPPNTPPTGASRLPRTGKRDASGRLQGGAAPSRLAEVPEDDFVPDWDPTAELGATGLRQFSGIVREELLPRLTGSLATKIYTEMAANDAIVKAALQAIDLTTRQVQWHVDPAGPSAADKEAAVFLESVRHDMAHTWTDHISEAMTKLVHGWSLFEIVYKKRGGPTDDPHTSSRFNDGRIGIRKLSIRAQDTLFRWQFDRTGGIQGMIQRPPPDYWERAIPIEKALLYRTAMRKNNPEGESILRGAYRAWHFKKRIEEIQAIGIERDLAGLPVALVPPALLSKTASPADQAILAELKKIVTNIRNDEQAGIVFPLLHDQHGNLLYDLKLLTTGGRRAFDTNAVLSYYDQRISMALSSDFLLLGHAKVGTESLGVVKLGMFSVAIGAFLDEIAEVLNRYLVPRLFALNGWQLEQLPRFSHEAVESADLKDVGEYLANLAKAGMPLFPDQELEAYAKRVAKFPISPQAQTTRALREQEGGAKPGAEAPDAGQSHLDGRAAADTTVESPATAGRRRAAAAPSS